MIVINGGSTPMINNVPPKSMLPRKKVYTVIQYTLIYTNIYYASQPFPICSASAFPPLPTQLSQLSISAREVDVGRACDVALLQDLKAFIDQRIEEPRATGRWTDPPTPTGYHPTGSNGPTVDRDGLVGRFVGEVEDGGDWWCFFLRVTLL